MMKHKPSVDGDHEVQPSSICLAWAATEKLALLAEY